MAVMREKTTTERDSSSLMSMHVDNLDLTIRAYNCLRLAGIVRVADLVRKTPTELYSIRNMGRKTVRVIEDSLHAVGLRLGMLPLPSSDSVASPEARASDGERESVVAAIQDVISMHVDCLRLTTRSSNGLRRAGIASVADLVRRSPAEIRAIQGMGVTSVHDIQDALALFGLRLAMSAEAVSAVLRGSSADAQGCDAFLDVMKLLDRAGVARAADVIRLTREEALGLPGVDSNSLQVIEDGLNRWGLRLRGSLTGTPTRVLQEEPTNVPATPEPMPPVKSGRSETALEELSRAVVDLLAGAKGASSRAFLAHHGLDGMPKRTLQEIGDAGDQYGFSRPVTRERVRQILKNTERRLRARSRHGQFVRWKSATDDALRDLPASVASFTSRFGTLSSLGPERAFKVLKFCAKTFRLEFPFDLQIEPELGSLIVGFESGAELAFASHLRKVAFDPYVDAADVATRIDLDIETVVKIVDASPRLEFLDDARRYFWRQLTLPPRNPILTSLCKVFSVATQVASMDLALSLPRDRMLRKAGATVEIPLSVVEGVARKSGLFHVCDGQIARKTGTEWPAVGQRDAALLGICAEHGRVVPSNVLYNALVRSGLARENATQVVVYSPFLVHTRSGVGPKEGIYKFVLDPADIDLGALNAHLARDGERSEGSEQAGAGGSYATLEEDGTSELRLEIPVSSRMRLSGRFFASAPLGFDGNWNVQDRDGVDLGLINIAGRTVTGLRSVVETLKLVKGDVMEMQFNRVRSLAIAGRRG